MLGTALAVEHRPPVQNVIRLLPSTNTNRAISSALKLHSPILVPATLSAAGQAVPACWRWLNRHRTGVATCGHRSIRRCRGASIAIYLRHIDMTDTLIGWHHASARRRYSAEESAPRTIYSVPAPFMFIAARTLGAGPSSPAASSHQGVRQQHGCLNLYVRSSAGCFRAAAGTLHRAYRCRRNSHAASCVGHSMNHGRLGRGGMRFLLHQVCVATFPAAGWS